MANLKAKKSTKRVNKTKLEIAAIQKSKKLAPKRASFKRAVKLIEKIDIPSRRKIQKAPKKASKAPTRKKQQAKKGRQNMRDSIRESISVAEPSSNNLQDQQWQTPSQVEHQVMDQSLPEGPPMAQQDNLPREETEQGSAVIDSDPGFAYEMVTDEMME